MVLTFKKLAHNKTFDLLLLGLIVLLTTARWCFRQCYLAVVLGAERSVKVLQSFYVR